MDIAIIVHEVHRRTSLPTAELERTVRVLKHKVEGRIVRQRDSWSIDPVATLWKNTQKSGTSLAFLLRTLLLFTWSDIKSVLIPVVLFALVHEHCATSFGLPPVAVDTLPAPFLRMVLRTAFWIWIILLPFDIDNQRMPESVAQDTLNKPWRPLPSRRLSPLEADELFWTTCSITFAMTMILGGATQAVGIAIVAWLYNHGGFADTNAWVRNATQVPGYLLFFSGATEVARGASFDVTNSLVMLWFAVLGGMILTTVHVLDMADQAGDAQSGRQTMPLAVGDENARFIIAGGALGWSVVVLWIFGLSLLPSVPLLALGGLIAHRTLMKRSVVQDKKTIRYWQAWSTVLYLTPLFKQLCSS